MKRFKKMLSILLTMAMTMAMTVTAFATAESSKYTQTTGHTYQVYQIFTGDYSNGVLSNIRWGQNGTGYDANKQEQDKVAETELEKLEAVKNSTDNVAKYNVIKEFVNLSSTAYRENSFEANAAIQWTELPAGYYLVRDKEGSLSGAGIENEAYTFYVVEVIADGTLTINPKVDIPTPDKKIVEGTDKVSTNEASIGDEVKYEITGTMPSNIADYKEYYYKFTDTLSKGLTYKPGSINVSVNGVDVTTYFSHSESGNGAAVVKNDDGTTTIQVGIQDVKGLKNVVSSVGDITSSTTIVLTYTAILNEDAVIAGDGNTNDVKLTYSNDPNNSGNGNTTPPENPNVPTTQHPTGESPEVEVKTFTTELTILKHNEENKFLPGTEFTLSGNGVNVVLVTSENFAPVEEGQEGEYWKLTDGTYTKEAPILEDTETTSNNRADYDDVEKKYTKTTSVIAKGNGKTETDVVGTVQEDGTVTFRGLGEGEYTITETKTLDGYNTIEPIKFKLTFDKATKKFSSNNDNVKVGADNMLDTDILNKSGSLLPSTGGIGTTIFYIVGAILVVGAAILLVTKKRMSKEA